MYRIIALTVIATVGGVVVQTVQAFAAIPGMFPLQAVEVLLTLLVAIMVAAVSWFLAARAIRALRQPTLTNMHRLYSGFIAIVFFSAWGITDSVVRGAARDLGDFIEVVAPWAAAICTSIIVNHVLRRWGLPHALQPAGNEPR